MGLYAVLAGLMFLAKSDTPGYLVRSEWYSLSAIAAGAVLVLIGTVVEVVSDTRGGRGPA